MSSLEKDLSAPEESGSASDIAPISAASDPFPSETPTTPSSIKVTRQIDTKEILHANILKLMGMLEETKSELIELRKQIKEDFDRIDANLTLQREKIKEHSHKMSKYEVVAENVEGYLHQLKVDGRQRNQIPMYRMQEVLSRSDVRLAIYVFTIALSLWLGRYTAR